jgi:hypothetical protein
LATGQLFFYGIDKFHLIKNSVTGEPYTVSMPKVLQKRQPFEKVKVVYIFQKTSKLFCFLNF